MGTWTQLLDLALAFLLASAVALAHFVIAFVYTPLSRRLPFGPRVSSELSLWYRPGEMVLARVLRTCKDQGYAVVDVAVDKSGYPRRRASYDTRRREGEGAGVAVVEDSLVAVTVRILGRASLAPGGGARRRLRVSRGCGRGRSPTGIARSPADR